MSDSLTISIPEIPEAVFADLQTQKEETFAIEVQAVAALREKYARLAKHNGHVKIAWSRRGDGSNWSEEKERFHETDGKRTRAFLCVDWFDEKNDDQNRGSYCGDRLYLAETGEWLRIERAGNWSHWQGESQWWGCGVSAVEEEEVEFDCETGEGGGSVSFRTDAEVVEEYDVAQLVAGLAKAIEGLAKRLPERMTRLRAQSAAAAAVLAAVAGK